MTEIVKQTDALVLNDEQKDLIKKTVAVGCTDNELKLFFYQCERTKLDPFSRQIHMVKRGGKATIQTGIDGFRAIAERSGKYAGNDEYTFNGGLTEYECSVKGVKQPHSATATIKKVVGGVICEFTASASWDAYCPKGSDFMWKKMPFLMLGKCAEALALRKAFPNDMSGLYTDDEMSQANVSNGSTVQSKTATKAQELKQQIATDVSGIDEDVSAEIQMLKNKKEKKVEKAPEPTLVEQIKEAIANDHIDEDTRNKVMKWIDTFDTIADSAAKECLDKLNAKIAEGEASAKKDKEISPDDLPF